MTFILVTTLFLMACQVPDIPEEDLQPDLPDEPEPPQERVADLLFGDDLPLFSIDPTVKNPVTYDIQSAQRLEDFTARIEWAVPILDMAQSSYDDEGPHLYVALEHESNLLFEDYTPSNQNNGNWLHEGSGEITRDGFEYLRRACENTVEQHGPTAGEERNAKELTLHAIVNPTQDELPRFSEVSNVNHIEEADASNVLAPLRTHTNTINVPCPDTTQPGDEELRAVITQDPQNPVIRPGEEDVHVVFEADNSPQAQQYRWQLQGETWTDWTTSSDFRARFTEPTPSRVVTLEVQDNEGNTDETWTSVRVEDGTQPVEIGQVRANGNDLAQVQEFENQENNYYVDDVQAANPQFTWNIEGQTYTGDSIYHTWQEAGTHNVEVTVTDEFGETNTRVETRTVQEAQNYEDGIPAVRTTTNGKTISIIATENMDLQAATINAFYDEQLQYVPDSAQGELLNLEIAYFNELNPGHIALSAASSEEGVNTISAGETLLSWEVDGPAGTYTIDFPVEDRHPHDRVGRFSQLVQFGQGANAPRGLPNTQLEI